MNWKKIDDNWKAFVKENQLIDSSEETHYLYGKQQMYSAVENFHDLQIYYQQKVNKSANPGSSTYTGNGLTITTPIETVEKWRVEIHQLSRWKQLFFSTGKLVIKASHNEINEYIPHAKIEKLFIVCPDLKLSIRKFEKYHNPNIPFDQTVLVLETKHQPETLEHLNQCRDIIINFLEKLVANKKLKPIDS
ncbi:hypothetical protein M0G43_07580 [Subsaxibacter sp. CAU 1640]|uniref:hypothetical protein n=1 Tax=Subsaxibacter sp. CAU 1640 TaxID=2933271 RepID=UPI002004ECE9|nr:hypothetical protein [Subsaxibacter sp. CAU 1640]MCK7590428.1 hypothetical protein [Subsaxibacter sp. CAU 1640]